MILFIDRLPFRSWQSGADVECMEIHLPIIPRDPGRSPPAATARPFRWRLDTACVRDGFAWTSHLLEFGLSPDQHTAGQALISTVLGNERECKVRAMDLWLISNVPGLCGEPFHLRPIPGIVLHQSPRPPPEFRYPLLGPSLLHRAGLKSWIDWSAKTISVWVPAPPLRSAIQAVRRLFSVSRSQPVPWANEVWPSR